MSNSLDQVHLTDMAFDCIVGILPSERDEPQRVELSVSLGLDLELCGRTGDLSESVDYAGIEIWLRNLAQQGRFWLIESLAEAACRGLLLEPTPCEERALIHTVQLTVRKPEILGGRAVPGVTVTRAGPVQALSHTYPNATCEVLVRTARDGAWRLILEDGATWSLPKNIGGCVISGVVRQGERTRLVGQSLARGGGDLVASEGRACVLLCGDPVTDERSGAYAG